MTNAHAHRQDHPEHRRRQHRRADHHRRTNQPNQSSETMSLLVRTRQRGGSASSTVATAPILSARTRQR